MLFYFSSGFDPLTLLAGLAFLAFLLQTLHALLYRQTASISSLGLSRKVTEPPVELEHAVGRALDRFVSTPDFSIANFTRSYILADYQHFILHSVASNSVCFSVLLDFFPQSFKKSNRIPCRPGTCS